MSGMGSTRPHYTQFHPNGYQIAHHDQHAKDCKFEISQRVMVRNFRSSGPKWIQGTILKQTGPLSYVLKIDSGEEWK